jgi:hypothetical protein
VLAQRASKDGGPVAIPIPNNNRWCHVAALYLANFHNRRAAAVIFQQLKKSRSGAGGDHFRILQRRILLWTGNLGEQF